MVTRKIHGIILSLKPAGDLDCLLLVFSREYGLVPVLAKGVKKITSRRGFHLDLFNYGSLEIEEIGNDIRPRRYLREITTARHFPRIKEQPEHFSAACVMASFLKRTLPQETPQKTLFDLMLKTLECLEESRNPHGVLSTSLLKILRLLGHLPHTLKKNQLKPALQKTLIYLDPEFTLNARRTLGIFSSLERTR